MTFVTPPFSAALFDRLHELNNAHAEDLSYKTREEFAALIGCAHMVLAGSTGLALLVAFSDESSYDNPNFRWLAARYERFLYIDRVVVSVSARGQGLARALYAALTVRALQEGKQRLVCEINLDPPNAVSDSFHEALGFLPIGSQRLPGQNKVVRYWSKDVG